MLPIHDDHPGHPTCNIVISKEGEIEQVCGNPADFMIWLTDPNDQSKIKAGVLVCHKHDQILETGKALIAVSENGEERLGVQYTSREGEIKNDDADAE